MGEDSVFCMPLHRPGKNGSLNVGAASLKIDGCPGVRNLGEVLFDNWPLIEISGDVVRSCTNELDSALLGLSGAAPINAGKNESWILTTGTPTTSRNHLKDLHVAGKDDEVYVPRTDITKIMP